MEAQRIKECLIELGIYSTDYEIKKDFKYIYLPVTKDPKLKYEVVEKRLKRIESHVNLRQALMKKLTKTEIRYLKTAYDTIGSIAVLEIDKELRKKEKLIAQTLLKANRNIKTVLRKTGAHEGEFRTQKLKYLAGVKTKEALYRENNITLRLDVEKVYFSIRLATERKRIYEQIKPGEEILVMFSGAGAYPIVLAKNTEAKEIHGIEINPAAHKYALENLKLNRVKNAKLILGNVREIIPRIRKRFDRILMPLPREAGSYLDLALTKIRKNGIIHLYDFLREDEIKAVPKQKISQYTKNFKILRSVKCGQFSPGVFRVCTDFVVR